MRIIEQKVWEVERTCSTCRSRLGIHAEDVKHRTYRDISQVQEDVFWFDCPVCKAETHLPANVLPRHIQDTAKGVQRREPADR